MAVASAPVRPRPRKPSRRWRAFVPLAFLFLAAAAAAPVAANHPQTATVDGTSYGVTFDHDGDNEWWVEVLVKAAPGDHVVTVEARVGTGAWHHLRHMSQSGDWHKWGTNAPHDQFRIPPGETVQFRASVLDSATGRTAFIVSCPFTHPAGVEQCSGAPPPPFDATFTGVRGNEWWVQANVATNGASIVKVDVTTDGGRTWRPLAKQSWGATAWAASYHLPQGTIVQLRATNSMGQTDLSSCRQWIPPPNQDAAIVSCGAPPAFSATFSNARGNEWWVEVVIQGNKPVDIAWFTIDCGPDTHSLEHRPDWGKWVKGMHVPAGSRVTFYAASGTEIAKSATYVWPQATPTTPCPEPRAWPVEGSYATYDLSNSLSGGGETFDTTARLHLVYANGAWTGTCTGTSTHTALDGTRTTTTWSDRLDGHGPMMLPTFTHVGATHDLDYFWTSSSGQTCEYVTSGFPVVVDHVEDRTTQMRDANGNPVVLRAWVADDNDIEGVENRRAAWDTHRGMVLDWDRSGRRSGMGSFGGDLVATDAPLQ